VEAPDPAWRGLWNAGARSADLLQRLVVYLATPLALALLFGEVSSLDRFWHAYLGSLIVTISIGGMFELAYRWIWRAIVRRKPSFAMRVVFHAITIVLVVAPGVLVAEQIAWSLFGWEAEFGRLWLQGMVISSVVITILVAADELGARSRELVRREAAHRVAVLKAELSALQARTDPHFLFNSLNTVAALIPDDPALAETLLEKLASVFRYALDAGRRASVELAEELEAVKAYLDVEQLRLGERLRWTLDLEPGLDGIRVPPLVLQPLVENAIRHGAGGRKGATEVTVSVRRRDGELVLLVEDRGLDDEAASPTPPGAGTALTDLRARIGLASADRASLDAGATPSGWRAEIVFPTKDAA
jgi:anti-sigma regulatory factor (Ser/Thr protein kinase)